MMNRRQVLLGAVSLGALAGLSARVWADDRHVLTIAQMPSHGNYAPNTRVWWRLQGDGCEYEEGHTNYRRFIDICQSPCREGMRLLWLRPDPAYAIGGRWWIEYGYG